MTVPALLLAALLTPSPATAPARKVALVVGVSQYRVPDADDKGGFGSLRYAHADAERMAKRLRELGWEVRLLQSFPGASDSVATKKGILAALQSVSTNPDDTLLFYFTGHGVQVDKRGYVVPFDGEFRPKTDAKGERLLDPDGAPVWTPSAATLLSYDEIGEAMKSVPALRRLLVFDACQDEPRTSKDGSQADGGYVLEKLGQVVKRSELGRPSWGVLSSCSAGERSYEDSRLWNGEGGGVFTKGLLDALSSPASARNDGAIVPALLSDALADSVRAWTQANSRRMTPCYTSEIPSGSPIVLGFALSSPPAPTENNRSRQPVETTLSLLTIRDLYTVGPFNVLDILNLTVIRQELNLTTQAPAINEELRRANDRLAKAANAAEREEIVEGTLDALRQRGVLTSQASKRLVELAIQRQGATAAFSPRVQDKIGATPEQRARIAKLFDQLKKASTSLAEREKLGEISAAESMASRRKNYATAATEIQRMLTPGQKEALQTLGGPPFKFLPTP